MCLVALAWRAHAAFPLVVAANRDESFQRPSVPAQEWPDAPGIYGGRDLLEGGSWMALAAKGRLAAVTNVREPQRAIQPLSRGRLVREFLLGDEAAAAGALRATQRADDYRPFNLLLWDGRELVHATNRPRPDQQVLAPGVHGISNGPLDAPWPKVRWTVEGLRDWLGALKASDGEPDVGPLFAALASEQRAATEELPQTGVALELEQRLSAPFIRGDAYGTRASTVLLVRRDGRATLVERNFGSGGSLAEERRLDLRLQLAPG